ncbi:MAG: M3 family metallopeptidase [Methyloligellaceae bacterium]
MNTNPLFKEWSDASQLPPFSQIKNEHFEEAFDKAIEQQSAEFLAIAEQEADPTFENTIESLEKSGQLLTRVCAVFFNLAAADTNKEIQRIQRDISPRLAKHNNDLFLNQKMFERVEVLCRDRKALGLTSEQSMLLTRYEKNFKRAGAQLDEKARGRINEISQRLAQISASFSQNVLKNEADYQLVLESEKDLEGLPASLVKSAARTAADRGMPGKKVITLSRSSIEPFLQFSTRRDLRETAFKAWINRGANGDEADNRDLIAETVRLRNEKARLLGFRNFAEYKLDNCMAKKPEIARELLMGVWEKAAKKVEEERGFLQQEMLSDGINDKLQPWDWRFYAERVRKEKFDLNDADIKPFFQLDNIINASFYTATKLFGITFEEVTGCEIYHPDVRVWDVKNAEGEMIARFIGDYFARPSKQGGAWMSSFRSQERLSGNIIPIIVNVLNLVKGGEGEPSLVTYDDATTIFHEFGHALHGMLSNVTYPGLSGTNVDRDFVELPSQLYEHWLSEPEVLNKFAVHYETGEAISESLLVKVNSARNFNQGFMTTEYLACALVDLQLHETVLDDSFDVEHFEADALQQLKMPSEIVMRHRLPHFQHLFSGESYASGYYSYMWSEVMDCDAFKAFEESGDVFNSDLALKLKKYIYSSGGTMDPEEAYQAFRGRQPSVEALLDKRGLK